MKRILLISTLAVVSASAFAAPSRNAFIRPTMIDGVMFTANPTGFRVDIGGMPRVSWGRESHKIVDVFGVYGLSKSDNFGSKGNDQNGWRTDYNFSGQGGVSGWKISPPQNGLQKNESLSFVYDGKIQGSPDSFGIHARLDNGCTYFFEAPCQAVPEPATMAALGLGGAALLRRRRARK